MRALGWLLLLVVWCTFTGCEDLSGGSVPIGEVDGHVYAPVRSVAPTPLVLVELRQTDDTLLQTTYTNTAGAFSFRDVPPGSCRLVARARDLTTTLDLERDSREPVSVTLRLGPRPHANGPLAVRPTENLISESDPVHPRQLHVGDALSFAAFEPVPAGNNPTPLEVNWGVVGRVGTITPDGAFRATSPGVGRIIAQSGDQRALFHVIVTDR
jgi:hypothetical protein